MSNFLSQISQFSLKPANNYNNEATNFRFQVSQTFKSIVLYFVLATLIFIPVFGLIKLINYLFEIDVLKIRDQNIKNGIGGAYSVLLIEVLIGPLVEELLFRLWLSLKKNHVFISLTTVISVIVLKCNYPYIYSLRITTIFWLLLAISILISAIIFKLFDRQFIVNKAKLNYKILYWCSCVGFGLIHITNFAPYKLNIIWAYPLFILPQLSLGFILAHLRIRHGFFWALLAHCVINSTLGIPHLLK